MKTKIIVLSLLAAISTSAVAQQTSDAVEAFNPIPGDPFQDHRIKNCNGTKGFGLLVYGTTAQTAIRLSDLCVEEDQGAVIAAESVSGLTQTKKGFLGRSYEDLSTGKPQYQRNAINITPNGYTGGCSKERVESLEYIILGDAITAFPKESFAMLQGYTTEHTSPRPAQERAEVLFGIRNVTQAETGTDTMPLGIINAFGDTYGEAVFDGDAGTLTIQMGGGHNFGDVSGSLEIEFTGDGGFVAQGDDIKIASNRLAGHAPIEMVSMTGSIPYMRGHVLGSTGTEMLGYGLFEGSYVDASGAEHKVRASTYLISCMQE